MFVTKEDTSMIINEWDPVAERPLTIRVSDREFREAAVDPGAAYRLASEIQEKYPEAVEVIAKYMRMAYKLGSTDAEEWLGDYYSDDGRFDAYV